MLKKSMYFYQKQKYIPLIKTTNINNLLRKYSITADIYHIFIQINDNLVKSFIFSLQSNVLYCKITEQSV